MDLKEICVRMWNGLIWQALVNMVLNFQVYLPPSTILLITVFFRTITAVVDDGLQNNLLQFDIHSYINILFKVTKM
jgi:hypothetical protein